MMTPRPSTRSELLRNFVAASLVLVVVLVGAAIVMEVLWR
jgi:hypothetical protein